MAEEVPSDLQKLKTLNVQNIAVKKQKYKHNWHTEIPIRINDEGLVLTLSKELLQLNKKKNNLIKRAKYLNRHFTKDI